MSATSTESDGGDTATTTNTINVAVAADADAPTLSVTSAVSGLEDTPVDLTISTGLTDTDGSESIDLAIEDVPVGATLTDGINTFTASGANTTADITGWDLGNLTVQAPPDSDADFTLQVVSTTTESANGDTAETRADIDVTITAVTDDVGFSATDGVGNEDTAISFSIAPTLGDTDGSETLDVQIGTIPVGATVTDGVNTFTATNANTSFDASTWNFSNLSVTPPADDANEFTLQITSTATESSTGATSTRIDSVNITVNECRRHAELERQQRVWTRRLSDRPDHHDRTHRRRWFRIADDDDFADPGRRHADGRRQHLYGKQRHDVRRHLFVDDAVADHHTASKLRCRV